jgi:integrase
VFSPYPQINILTKRLNSVSSRKIKYLSKREVEGFFSCVRDPRDRALFGLIYLYGLRVSEAALLKLQDVDFRRKRIAIPRVKGGIGGEKPLFKIAGKLLERYLEARLETGNALFTGRQGNLKKQRIQQLFKEYAQKAGIAREFSVHSLRHSIATHLLEAGKGIEFVKDHLGHRNIQNTIIYAQLTDRSREEAYRRLENGRGIARL